MIVERQYTPDEIDILRDVVTAALLDRGGTMSRNGRSIRFACPNPLHVDKHPSTDWAIETGVWVCRSRRCEQHMGGGGTIALARALGLALGGELTPEATAALEAAKTRAAESRQAERENAAEAAARVVASGYVDTCFDRMRYRPELIAALGGGGVTLSAAGAAFIGFDEHPPIFGRPPSLAIPWIDSERPEWLVSVQYRSLTPDADSRYRWHGGIGQNGATLFNIDCLRSRPDRVIVVEGAGKALALIGHGYEATIGTYNATSFGDAECARLAASGAEIVFIPDPDAFDAVREKARSIPGARIVCPPGSPDDFAVEAGWHVIGKLIDQARAA